MSIACSLKYLLNRHFFLCGNSNTGNQIKRILRNISVSALIMEISPVTLYRIGICCHMINRITFVNPLSYDKFARAAFNSLMCDLGNFANVSANTHSLFCHASLYIRWAKEELGISLGSLTEGCIEMGNKLNLFYQKMFTRRGDIKQENYDIFKRRLMISDYYLVIEGVLKQQLRRGNVRNYRKSIK